MTDNEDEVFIIPEISIDELDIAGNGNKRLVVVVDKTEYGVAESETLVKMINAIKFDMTADIFLIQMKSNQNISLNNLLPEYKDLILFGIEPSRLGIFVDFVQYEIMPFEQTRMLVIDSISTINRSQPKKVLLWNKLQEMFLKK